MIKQTKQNLIPPQTTKPKNVPENRKDSITNPYESFLKLNARTTNPQT
jgi:hypothetical protein